MRISVLILFLTVFSAQISIGQDNTFISMKDTKAFTEKFDEISKKLTSIKSDFIQEKHLSFMEDNITSKGIFKYKKENKVRLQYTSPFEYLMVLNNGKMYIKDGNKVNKFDTHSNKLFRQINDMMINTLNGNILQSKEYGVNYYENESMYLLELSPKDKTVLELVQKIKIYIDKKKLNVNKIELKENSGDYTLLSFINVLQNSEIKDEEFIVK